MIWITEAREIENYLTQSVLHKLRSIRSEPGKYTQFWPSQSTSEKSNSFLEKEFGIRFISKVDLALSSTKYMNTIEDIDKFDLLDNLNKIRETVYSWK